MPKTKNQNSEKINQSKSKLKMNKSKLFAKQKNSMPFAQQNKHLLSLLIIFLNIGLDYAAYHFIGDNEWALVICVLVNSLSARWIFCQYSNFRLFKLATEEISSERIKALGIPQFVMIIYLLINSIIILSIVLLFSLIFRSF